MTSRGRLKRGFNECIERGHEVRNKNIESSRRKFTRNWNVMYCLLTPCWFRLWWHYITPLHFYGQKDLHPMDGNGSDVQILMILILSRSRSFRKTISKKTCFSSLFLWAEWFMEGLTLFYILASTVHCSPGLLWPAPVLLPNRVSSPLKTWAILVPPLKTQRGTTQLLFMHSAP